MGHGKTWRRIVVGGTAVPIAPELISRPLAALER